MTPSIRLILALLALSLAVGVWGASILIAESGRRRVLAAGTWGDDYKGAVRSRRLMRRAEKHWPVSLVAQRLRRAGVDWSASTTFLALVVACLVIYLGGQVLIGRIGSTLVALCIPSAFFQWLKRRAARRREEFIAQLPELARIIANGNAAGLSMGRCVAMAGRELPDPAGEEMRRCANRMNLGWSVDATLGELAERLPSREIDVLVRTIVIQSRTGGALSAALADIAGALEDRKELRRDVATAILGSAISGYAVMLMGGGAVILLNLMEPGLLDEMAGNLLGQIVLIVSVILFAVGSVLIRLVSRIEV